MLEIQNLNLSYDATPVLKQIHLQFNSGIHSIIGPSGSGKTSLLRCIAGLETYTGTITGVEPKRLGYLEQHLTLFPHLTVGEQIAYPLTLRHLSKHQIQARVTTLLKQYQLTNLVERYPHQLSGGEQRQVMLARVLSYQPTLLLCDEPFAAVDALTRVRLVRAFKQQVLTDGLTVLYVTHDPAEAGFISQHGVIIEAGQVVAQGRWDDLSHPILQIKF